LFGIPSEHQLIALQESEMLPHQNLIYFANQHCGKQMRQLSVRTLTLACLMACTTAYIKPAIAADDIIKTIPKKTYAIPAGDLSEALPAYAAEAGVLLGFEPSLTNGKKTTGLKGQYSLSEGFAQLLKDSDLEVVNDDKGGYTLKKAIITNSQNLPIDVELKQLNVHAKRFYEMGPLPGLGLSREQIPGNVQSVSAQEIKDSHALSLAELMNAKLQSVNVNDYQGNPFQMDVTYRGFTAGPQLGTPQGLSVFFDGIRVNEPFGDVVNWDMIPMNAISTLDVFPGSNPIFGLNTLGGALSVKTKSGFDDDIVSVELTGGSFGRKQLQVEAGGNNGVIAGFVAANIFDENGWRDNSPSKVNQIFGKGEWRNENMNISLSSLYVGNDLVGNGLIPYELYQDNPKSVFTSPDETKNRLLQFQISGAFNVSDTFNITSQAYNRISKRRSVNGDFYQAFDEMVGTYDYARETSTPSNNLPLCQYQDLDGNGIWDTTNGSPWGPMLPPINNPTNAPGVCNATTRQATLEPLILRNGANGDAGYGGNGTGVVNGTPIGQIDTTTIDQVTRGGAVQFNWNLEKHKFMTGVSFDTSNADYSSVSRLALIDASHNVYLDPANISPLFYAASNDITNNAFDGSSRTASLYFSETWTPVKEWNFAASARYNKSRVTNNLKSRTASGFAELHNLKDFAADPDVILCQDPANCPTQPNASTTYTDDARASGLNGYYRPNGNFGDRSSLDGHKEKFSYYSLNPSIGASFSPEENINLYGNWSQGTRAPSVIELGCAYSKDPALQSAGACTLPSQLSGDPYLPQIKATTNELGVRGVLNNKWKWNVSAYQTDLKDDIYFTSLSSSRSYFDTIGDTRRKGIEFGYSGSIGRADISVNYGLTSATFESPFHMFNLANSSTNFDPNDGVGPGMYKYIEYPNGGYYLDFPKNSAYLNKYGQSSFRQYKIEPGSRMPGIPLHNLNAAVNFRVTDRWQVGLTMLLRSSAIARGNENNKHRKGPASEQLGQIAASCNPAFDSNTGEFTGYFQCDAQPSTTVGQPYTRNGSTPGFAVFNFMTTYKLDKGLTLGLQVNNLFDRQYYTGSQLGANPFSPSINGAIGPSGFNYNSKDWQKTSFVAPGAPRAAWLTLTYDFDQGRK
jgi:iron complex outermembrane recepter protein